MRKEERRLRYLGCSLFVLCLAVIGCANESSGVERNSLEPLRRADLPIELPAESSAGNPIRIATIVPIPTLVGPGSGSSEIQGEQVIDFSDEPMDEQELEQWIHEFCGSLDLGQFYGSEVSQLREGCERSVIFLHDNDVPMAVIREGASDYRIIRARNPGNDLENFWDTDQRRISILEIGSLPHELFGHGLAWFIGREDVLYQVKIGGQQVEISESELAGKINEAFAHLVKLGVYPWDEVNKRRIQCGPNGSGTWFYYVNGAKALRNLSEQGNLPKLWVEMAKANRKWMQSKNGGNGDPEDQFMPFHELVSKLAEHYSRSETEIIDAFKVVYESGCVKD